LVPHVSAMQKVALRNRSHPRPPPPAPVARRITLTRQKFILEAPSRRALTVNF
jgi:hypothetical protein